MNTKKHVLFLQYDLSLYDALTYLLTSDKFKLDAYDTRYEKKNTSYHSIDITIIDIPYENCEKEARKLLHYIQSSNHKKVPILLTSTNIKIHSIAKSIHADDFLEEPFDVDTFLKKVQQLIGR